MVPLAEFDMEVKVEVKEEIEKAIDKVGESFQVWTYEIHSKLFLLKVATISFKLLFVVMNASSKGHLVSEVY